MTVNASPMRDDTRSDVIEVPDEAPVNAPPGARRPTDLITPEQLKHLSSRSNTIGLLYLASHLGCIVATGALLWYVTTSFESNGVWIAPALLLHGIVISYLFSPVHECAHFTAFRSRWLNEAAYWLFCSIYIVAPNWFRYFHLSHHRYTMIPGKDPEVITQFQSKWQWLRYVSAIDFWWRNLWRIVRHATLGPDAEDIRGAMHVPRQKYPKLVREARIMLGVYLLLFAAAWWFGVVWWLVWLWLVPRLVGEPVQRMLRVAEHTGCDLDANIMNSTRTTLTTWPLRSLGWQMPFHVEHHLFPNVPFFSLPKVHREIREQIVHLEARGYVRGQINLVSELTKSARAAN